MKIRSEFTESPESCEFKHYASHWTTICILETDNYVRNYNAFQNLLQLLHPPQASSASPREHLGHIGCKKDKISIIQILFLKKHESPSTRMPPNIYKKMTTFEPPQFFQTKTYPFIFSKANFLNYVGEYFWKLKHIITVSLRYELKICAPAHNSTAQREHWKQV